MPDSTHSRSGFSIEMLRMQLPGYEVLREVGHGAMGIVFEAIQGGLDRRVAVKVLPPNLALRERTVKRFLREAEAMGKLGHPGIVDIFEVGSLKGLHFFSMKYVDGPPLDRVLKAGPLGTDDVVSLGIDVAEALAHAHGRGVLHRDVKPANLLRSGDSVLLTDFGLARPIDSEDAGTMTESGDLVGTPLYMAPEQISGDGDQIDGRVDVWGLGVTLYELLAGRPPFSGPNAQGILHAILHKDPPRLSKVRDDVTRDLEAVVFKCLEKDPGRRYVTAAALRDDLRAVAEGRAVSAAAPRFFDPALRWLRRHPVEASMMGAVLLIAFLLGSYLISTSKKLEDATSDLDAAQTEREGALRRGDDEMGQRLVTWARLEMEEVRDLHDQATTNEERKEAEDRLIDVIEQIRVDEFPEIAAEAIEMLAGWLHERGLDDQALAYIDLIASDEDPKLKMLLRAAALVGQGRMGEALAQHHERASFDRGDPSPALDAARLLHRMAMEDLEALEERAARGRLANALTLLERAAELAVARSDEDMLRDVAIERARCRLDLGDPESAIADLDMVLAQDPTAFEAFSLRKLCERRLRETSDEVASAPSVASNDPTSVEEERPALSLDSLLPGREDLTQNLQSAGQDLQSIYRGLQDLMEKAAFPDDGEEEIPPPPGGDPVGDPGGDPAVDPPVAPVGGP